MVGVFRCFSTFPQHGGYCPEICRTSALNGLIGVHSTVTSAPMECFLLLQHTPTNVRPPANPLNFPPLRQPVKLGQHTGGNFPNRVPVGLVHGFGMDGSHHLVRLSGQEAEEQVIADGLDGLARNTTIRLPAGMHLRT